MTGFFVGARVRIIGGCRKDFIGVETRIIGDRVSREGLCPAWELAVANPITGYGWLVSKENAGDVLTPILPDGQRPGEFTTMQDLLHELNGVMA